MTTTRLIIALDFPAADLAFRFVRQLSPDTCKLKVGFELFVAAGPAFVGKLVDLGFDVFLDLKFHDIPNTVAAACKTASHLGVWMMNVHALGGEKMLEAAANSIQSVEKPPLLIAVTILTSMDEQQLSGIGINEEPRNQVLKLAEMTKNNGLDGVVCSAQEANMLNTHLGNEFQLVTPGIRPTNSEKGDQSRVMTPLDAIKSGASYLVVGRPITQANEPLSVIEGINNEIVLATQ